ESLTWRRRRLRPSGRRHGDNHLLLKRTTLLERVRVRLGKWSAVSLKRSIRPVSLILGFENVTRHLDCDAKPRSRLMRNGRHIEQRLMLRYFVWEGGILDRAITVAH